MARHAVRSLFECKYCGRRFLRESMLKLHNKLVAQKVKSYCLECKSLAGNPKALHKHALTHTKVRPYECYTCKKKFTSLVYLNKHTYQHSVASVLQFSDLARQVKVEITDDDDDDESMESNDGDDDHDDGYDEYVLGDDHSLNKHLKFKTDWKIYSTDPLFKPAKVVLTDLKILICWCCGKAVTPLYDNGLTLDAGLTTPTKCLKCQGELFPWDGDLSQIAGSIQLLRSPPLQCICCNHVFPSMAKLRKHMQVHAEATNHVCTHQGETSGNRDPGNSHLCRDPGSPVQSSSTCGLKLDRCDSTPEQQAATDVVWQQSEPPKTSPDATVESRHSARSNNESTPRKILQVNLCRITSVNSKFLPECLAGSGCASKGTKVKTGFTGIPGRDLLSVNHEQSKDLAQGSVLEESLHGNRAMGRGKGRGKARKMYGALRRKVLQAGSEPSSPSLDVAVPEKSNAVQARCDRTYTVRKSPSAWRRKTQADKDLQNQGCDKPNHAAFSDTVSPGSECAGNVRLTRKRFQITRLRSLSPDVDLGCRDHALLKPVSSTSSSCCGQRANGDASGGDQLSIYANSELRVSVQRMAITPLKEEKCTPDASHQNSKDQNPLPLDRLCAPAMLASEAAATSLGGQAVGARQPGASGPHLSAHVGSDEKAIEETPNNMMVNTVTLDRGESDPIHSSTGKVRKRRASLTSAQLQPVRRSQRAPKGLPWTWYDDREYAHTCRICGKTFLLLDRLRVHAAAHQRARLEQME